MLVLKHSSWATFLSLSLPTDIRRPLAFWRTKLLRLRLSTVSLALTVLPLILQLFVRCNRMAIPVKIEVPVDGAPSRAFLGHSLLQSLLNLLVHREILGYTSARPGYPKAEQIIVSERTPPA